MLRPVLVFGLALFLAACGPSATPTPEPTATPEATATPEPTATPAVNTAVIEYVDWAVGAGLESARLMGDLGSQMGEASDDSTVLRQEPWTTDTIAVLVAIKTLALEIQDRPDVPPEAGPVHRKLLDLATELKTVAEDLADGIDYLDAEKIESSTAAMGRASALSEPIAAELTEIGKAARGQ